MNQGPYQAALLDLDGVVTRTARIHARAWKAMFDGFLESRSREEGSPHEPFRIDPDYRELVDGKPRHEGATSFLESRGIELPAGDPEDPPGTATIHGLANRKNELFHRILESEGAEAYPDAVEQLERWRKEGLKTALISSSRNGAAILEATGLTHLFDSIIDGVTAAELGLPGKPAPDTFLEAARRLEVEPGLAFVVEDAESGVQAGRAGGFGLVVGVARNGGEDLVAHGADVVVGDLREIDLG